LLRSRRCRVVLLTRYFRISTLWPQACGLNLYLNSSAVDDDLIVGFEVELCIKSVLLTAICLPATNSINWRPFSCVVSGCIVCITNFMSFFRQTYYFIRWLLDLVLLPIKKTIRLDPNSWLKGFLLYRFNLSNFDNYRLIVKILFDYLIDWLRLGFSNNLFLFFDAIMQSIAQSLIIQPITIIRLDSNYSSKFTRRHPNCIQHHWTSYKTANFRVGNTRHLYTVQFDIVNFPARYDEIRTFPFTACY
jgi:hypothetical protein